MSCYIQLRATTWRKIPEAGYATMEQLKDVRALRRGLAVLDLLSGSGPAGLSDIARATGLAKSTTRRILATLEDTGHIRRNLADSLYRSNIGGGGPATANTSKAAGAIVRAARPVLERLSQEVVWPSDLFIRDGTELQIVETTRPLSPLLVNRNEIGDRVDMLTTAVGRVYLAFCPDGEREELLAVIGKAHAPASQNELLETIDHIRKTGFAVRDPRCTGATYRNPFIVDRLYAVAVPVMDRDKVACCINLLWPVAAASSVGDERLMAKLLQERAAEISANLSAAARS